MAYTLEFNTNVTGSQQLNAIEQAMARIQNGTKLTSKEFIAFQSWVENTVKSGKNLETELSNLTARTSGASSAMKAAARDLGTFVGESQKAQNAAQQLGKAMDAAITENARRAQRAVDDLAKSQVRQAAEAKAANASLLTGITQLGYGTGVASYQFASLARGITTFGGTIGATALAIGGAGVAIGLLGKFALDAASDVAKYAQEVTNASARTGLSAIEFQAFGLSADVVGVSASALTTAMRTLSKGLSEGSDEGRKQKLVLNELGIAAADSLGRIKPIGELLPQIFDKLASLPAGLNRDNFLVTLFGRGGLELAPLLGRLDELKSKVTEVGAVLSGEAVSSANKYAEQLNILGIAVDGLKHKLGLLTFPIVSNLINGFTGNLPDNSGAAPFSPFVAASPRTTSIDISKAIARTGSFNVDLNAPLGLDANAAAANSVVRRFASRGGQRGLEDQLKEAEALLSITPKPQEGQFKSAQEAEDAVRKYSEAESKVDGLKAAIAAAKKETKDLTAEARELASAIRDLSGAGENAFVKLNQNFQKDLANPLLQSSQDQSKIRSAYLTGALRLLSEENDKTKKESIRKAEESDNLFYQGQELAQRSTEAVAKQGIARLLGSEANGGILNEIGKGLGPADPQTILRALQGQTAQAVRQVQVSAKPGDELTTAARVAAIEIDSAQKRKSFEDAIANTDRERQDNELNFQEQLFAIRSTYEDKLIEKQKQSQADFRNAIEGGASALLGGGAGGLQKYIQGYGRSILTKVAGNAADIVYPSIKSATGGIGLDDSTILGKLVKGTPFGKENNPLVSLQTDANKYLQGIYQVLSGTDAADPNQAASSSAGSAGGSLLPGILGITKSTAAVLSGSGGSGAANVLRSISGIGGIFAGAAASDNVAIDAGGDSYDNSDLGEYAAYDNRATQNGTITSASKSSIAANSAFANTPEAGIINYANGTGSATNAAISGISTAGTLYAGYRGISSGISQGGARGYSNAIASGAGTAAALDPEPISKAILGGIALAATVVGAIFGDPRQNRINQLNKEIGNSKYEAPTTISKTVDGSGNYTDYDRFGNVRTSPFSGNPIVSQSGQYYINGQYIPIPGGVVSPFSSPQSPSSQSTPASSSPSIQVNVQTLDSKSFQDNSAHIADAVAHHFSTQGGGQLMSAIRYSLSS